MFRIHIIVFPDLAADRLQNHIQLFRRTAREEGQEDAAAVVRKIVRDDQPAHGYVVVVDVNHQQLEGWTKDVMNIEPLADRFEAFGWKAVTVNGHDIEALQEAAKVEHTGKPLVLLCQTNPDQDMPIISDQMPKHFIRVTDKTREKFTQFYENM